MGSGGPHVARWAVGIRERSGGVVDEDRDGSDMPLSSAFFNHALGACTYRDPLYPVFKIKNLHENEKHNATLPVFKF